MIVGKNLMMNIDNTIKRVAIITNSLQGGGAERCAADLSVFYENNNYTVYIFTDLQILQQYQYKGRLINFSFDINYNKFVNEKSAWVDKIEELSKLKEQYQIDISISFMQFANYLNILSKGHEKVILTTHSVNSIYAKMDSSVFWSEHTFKELYQYADLITFPSEYCRNDWIQHYGDKNSITKTVYNPVHIMNATKEQQKEKIIIAIGRMHSIKRQWHLIKAFKKVHDTLPEYHLVILGEGSLRTKLESLVQELGLSDSVEMPGNVSNVSEYLAKSKVMVMTSYCEAMPCSVLEALSAGVPVISCDSPGGIREELGVAITMPLDREALEGECGVITPYIKENDLYEYSYEEQVLADEILKFLQDTMLQNRLSQNAKRSIEKFYIENIGKIWINEIFPQELNKSYDPVTFEKEKEFSLSTIANHKINSMDMYISYFRLLENWMKAREENRNVKDYFYKNGYKNIVIYGLGKMASHLFFDLKDSDVKVIGAIDKGAINKFEEYPVVTIDDDIPKADCIVVTIIYDYENVKRILKEKMDCPIVSLMDVINDIASV